MYRSFYTIKIYEFDEGLLHIQHILPKVKQTQGLYSVLLHFQPSNSSSEQSQLEIFGPDFPAAKQPVPCEPKLLPAPLVGPLPDNEPSIFRGKLLNFRAV